MIDKIRRIVATCERELERDKARDVSLERFDRLPKIAAYDIIKNLVSQSNEELEEELNSVEEIPIALDKIEDFLKMIHENSVDVEVRHKSIDDCYGDPHDVTISRTDKCLICRDEVKHSMKWMTDDFEKYFKEIKLNRHGCMVSCKLIILPKEEG
jgi:hypothetical protein